MSIEKLVRDNTAFALALYQQLSEQDGNLFFSPYSISSALAMTYAGARGQTAAQMETALHFSPGDELHADFKTQRSKISSAWSASGEGMQIEIANALWPQADHPFLEEYLALVREYYGTEITPIDYSDSDAARQVINAWVAEQSGDKIQNLIGPGSLTPDTRLVLTNAIYFRGDWKSAFETDDTETLPFFLSDGSSTLVSLMYQENSFGYSKEPGFQILELPYANRPFSMIILLPDDNDLVGLESQLTSGKLLLWTSHIPRSTVQVWLPRFKLEMGFQLNEALMALGMQAAFDPAQADFSGMDLGKGRLFISSAIHKAYVNVNEKGTEAAAATAMMSFAVTGPSEESPIFRADHPFFFLIREKTTGSILFMGRVTNPAAEE